MIMLSPQAALLQTEPTVTFYLQSVISMLDKEFGRGYAKQNPQLVGTLVQTMAVDFATAAGINMPEWQKDFYA